MHEALTRLHSDACEAWTRQEFVVEAMRADVDAGSGNGADRGVGQAQLGEQVTVAAARAAISTSSGWPSNAARTVPTGAASYAATSLRPSASRCFPPRHTALPKQDGTPRHLRVSAVAGPSVARAGTRLRQV